MRGAVLAFMIGGAIACNAITGASKLSTDDEGPPIELPDGSSSSSSSSSGTATSSSSGGASSGADVTQPPIGDFKYRRAVTLTSDASGELTNHAILVMFPSDFDDTHAQPDGRDVRFRAAGGTTDLDCFVEQWTAGKPKIVWVKVPLVKPGASSLDVFYGSATAAPISDLTKTFARVKKTAGGGAGSFVAMGDIDVDWFELAAGDVLTLEAGKPLVITASRVIIAGKIDGVGLGSGPGPLANTAGLGPGGGGFVNASGAGGGGYGGMGGLGGTDAGGTGGAAGATYGTNDADDIAMGSGGGSAGTTKGGAGGGAVTIFGARATIGGGIFMNGANGITTATGQAGGAGSGGGILVGGTLLELGGAALEAKGGAGGDATNSAGDAGGGGGGGRIKIRQRAGGSLVPPAATVVTGGAGGAGVSTAPGAAGAIGTTSTSTASTAAKGVEAKLGAEVML